MGGIVTAGDAVEFMLCGASAVQVGTATFANPKAATGIIGGIKKYLIKSGIKSVKGLTGGLKP
jgi:dihydroorotate dehydrogenase (NAD+) catalytic subunit